MDVVIGNGYTATGPCAACAYNVHRSSDSSPTSPPITLYLVTNAIMSRHAMDPARKSAIFPSRFIPSAIAEAQQPIHKPTPLEASTRPDLEQNKLKSMPPNLEPTGFTHPLQHLALYSLTLHLPPQPSSKPPGNPLPPPLPPLPPPQALLSRHPQNITLRLPKNLLHLRLRHTPRHKRLQALTQPVQPGLREFTGVTRPPTPGPLPRRRWAWFRQRHCPCFVLRCSRLRCSCVSL